MPGTGCAPGCSATSAGAVNMSQDTPAPRISPETRAANILVRAGAQFVDDALRDNPAGPIRMHAEISRTEIVYVVVIGAPSTDGAPSSARCIWQRFVKFRVNDRHVAGGCGLRRSCPTTGDHRMGGARTAGSTPMSDKHVHQPDFRCCLWSVDRSTNNITRGRGPRLRYHRILRQGPRSVLLSRDTPGRRLFLRTQPARGSLVPLRDALRGNHRLQEPRGALARLRAQ